MTMRDIFEHDLRKCADTGQAKCLGGSSMAHQQAMDDTLPILPPSPWKRAWSTRNAASVPGVTDWDLAIDAPLHLNDADAHDWQAHADIVVVGLGGTGIAAALEGLDQGLTIIALDTSDGGGFIGGQWRHVLCRRRNFNPARGGNFR